MPNQPAILQCITQTTVHHACHVLDVGSLYVIMQTYLLLSNHGKGQLVAVVMIVGGVVHMYTVRHGYWWYFLSLTHKWFIIKVTGNIVIQQY